MMEVKVTDRGWLGVLARWYLGLLTLGLPFWFSCQVMGTETPNLPLDLLVWVILGFTPSAPTFLAPLLVGVGLLLVIAAYPKVRVGDGSLRWIVIWYAPFLAGLVGLIQTTEWDYALNWLLHFWGVASFALSVWWASRHDRQMLPLWCLCVAAGTLILCGYGIYQRFGGLESQLAEMKAQHLKEYGEPLAQRIQDKLSQKRVNSFFSDPNVFAAHLLLTIPLVGLCCLKLKCLASPKLRMLALVGTGLLGLFMLVMTGSRGGMIGLVAGLGLGVWTLPWLQARRWKWFLPLIAGLLCLGVWYYASTGLSKGQVSTASVRFEYYRVALKMFADSPWTGQGLGEFYPYYVRTKPLEAEMTRDPHSFFLGALGQCGIWGGLAVLLVLCFPFVQAIRRTSWRGGRERETMSAMQGWAFLLPLAGMTGWAVHSFFQFNELIPGTVYLLPVFPLLVMAEQTEGKAVSRELSWCWLGPLFVGLCCILIPCVKIPAEARFQKVSEDLHFYRRDMHQGLSGLVMGDWETRRLVMVNRRNAILRELQDLCDDMPVSLGPCKLLQECLREELMSVKDSAMVPRETLELLQSLGEKMMQRTPHRNSVYNDFAWACLALGEAEKASKALTLARQLYPGDARGYLLASVVPGNWDMLKEISGLKGSVCEDGQGGLKVIVSEYSAERREELTHVLKGWDGVAFQLPKDSAKRVVTGELN